MKRKYESNPLFDCFNDDIVLLIESYLDLHIFVKNWIGLYLIKLNNLIQIESLLLDDRPCRFEYKCQLAFISQGKLFCDGDWHDITSVGNFVSKCLVIGNTIFFVESCYRKEAILFKWNGDLKLVRTLPGGDDLNKLSSHCLFCESPYDLICVTTQNDVMELFRYENDKWSTITKANFSGDVVNMVCNLHLVILIMFDYLTIYDLSSSKWISFNLEFKCCKNQISLWTNQICDEDYIYFIAYKTQNCNPFITAIFDLESKLFIQHQCQDRTFNKPHHLFISQF